MNKHISVNRDTLEQLEKVLYNDRSLTISGIFRAAVQELYNKQENKQDLEKINKERTELEKSLEILNNRLNLIKKQTEAITIEKEEEIKKEHDLDLQEKIKKKEKEAEFFMYCFRKADGAPISLAEAIYLVDQRALDCFDEKIPIELRKSYTQWMENKGYIEYKTYEEWRAYKIEQKRNIPSQKIDTEDKVADYFNKQEEGAA